MLDVLAAGSVVRETIGALDVDAPPSGDHHRTPTTEHSLFGAAAVVSTYYPPPLGADDHRPLLTGPARGGSANP